MAQPFVLALDKDDLGRGHRFFGSDCGPAGAGARATGIFANYSPRLGRARTSRDLVGGRRERVAIARWRAYNLRSRQLAPVGVLAPRDTLLWEAATGRPLAPASSGRTAHAACAKLKAAAWNRFLFSPADGLLLEFRYFRAVAWLSVGCGARRGTVWGTSLRSR